MEQLGLLGYNPHIHMVLKTFQDAAIHSLRGPSRFSSSWSDPTKMSAPEIEEYKKTLASCIKGTNMDIKPSSFPTQIPFLFAMDTSRSEKSETVLEGETIACFVVGGEKRLCLPQILNTLLRPFSMEQVYEACNELHIFFSRCNPEQLHILKALGVLPESAPNCGLITKTDAERLCHKLLYSSPEKSNVNPPSPNSFKVYHECFGKCKGVFIPELYTHPNALCIQCCDCEGMFSAPHFVCHSHKALENRTCHWGFDSANWRAYLLLAKDQSHMNKLEKYLEDIKERFDLKRKESSEDKCGEKKVKYEDVPQIESAILEQIPLLPWKASLCSELPAFLQRGPPVILNPERVVPFTTGEKQRDTESFAPNVSLAPACQQKVSKGSDKAEDLSLSASQDHQSDKLQFEEDVNDNLEIDVSTDDTENVSDNSDSGVSTPTERVCSSLNVCVTEREQELKMLRDALDGRVANTDRAKEEFIEDFMRLRIREDIKLKQLENVKRDLQKELEFVKFAKKQKIQEINEAKKGLKKEVERLRIERDVKAQELEEERKMTKQQLDASTSKAPNMHKLKAHYKRKIEALKTKLNQHEQVHTQMTQELTFLRDQLQLLGKDVPNIKYEIAADEPSLLATLTSPRLEDGNGESKKKQELFTFDHVSVKVKKEPVEEKKVEKMEIREPSTKDESLSTNEEVITPT